MTAHPPECYDRRADVRSPNPTIAATHRYTPNINPKHQSDGPEWPTDSMPYLASIFDQTGMSANVAAKVTGIPIATISTVVASRCQV